MRGLTISNNFPAPMHFPRRTRRVALHPRSAPDAYGQWLNSNGRCSSSSLRGNTDTSDRRVGAVIVDLTLRTAVVPRVTTATSTLPERRLHRHRHRRCGWRSDSHTCGLTLRHWHFLAETSQQTLPSDQQQYNSCTSCVLWHVLEASLTYKV